MSGRPKSSEAKARMVNYFWKACEAGEDETQSQEARKEGILLK